MSSESRAVAAVVGLLIVPLVVSLAWILVPQPARPWAEREVAAIILVPIPAARSELVERVELGVERGSPTALLYGGPSGVVERVASSGDPAGSGEVIMTVGGGVVRALVADRPLSGPVSLESPEPEIRAVAEVLVAAGVLTDTTAAADPDAFAQAVDAYALQQGWVPPEPGVFDPGWVIWLGPRPARLELNVMLGVPAEPGQVIGQTTTPVLALVLGAESPRDATVRISGTELAGPADGRLTGEELSNVDAEVPPDGTTFSAELVVRPEQPVLTVATSSVVRSSDGRTCVLRVPPGLDPNDEAAVRARLESVPVEVLSGSPGLQHVVGELAEGDAIVGNVSVDGLPRGC